MVLLLGKSMSNETELRNVDGTEKWKTKCLSVSIHLQFIYSVLSSHKLSLIMCFFLSKIHFTCGVGW